MERNLFQRTIGQTKNGKDIKAWYYWYLDDTGKQVIRTCGEKKKPCMLKRDAEAVLARLAAEDERQEAEKRARLAQGLNNEMMTIRSVCETMYVDSSDHLRYRETWKWKIADSTRDESRSYLMNFILPRWGDATPSQIDSEDVKNWIATLQRPASRARNADKTKTKPYSISTKNRIIEILNEVLDECLRLKLIAKKPEIPHIKHTKKKRKDILYSDDMLLLFPADTEKLIRVWSKPGEDALIGLCFGTMYKMMVSTGLRPGEARAAEMNQITLDRRGIIIDKMVDVTGKVVPHLKMGDDEEDPRLRVSVIPKETADLLKMWMEKRPKCDNDLLFFYNGKMIRPEYFHKRLTIALENAGIDFSERKITPHSMRYTYTTRMRRLIPSMPLRTMTGHRDEAMTDYYTRSELMAELASLQTYEQDIDRFWA